MPVGIAFTAIRPPRSRALVQPLRSKLDRFTKRVANEIKEAVSDYPPVPSDSYQRTYDLLAAWRVIPESTSNDVRWQIRNDTEYANLVHGAEQWPPHRWHGWRTVDEVVAEFNRDGRLAIGAQAIMTDTFANWFR